MLDICFITDENYLPATLTAIKSVLFNNTKENICIHVICSGLNESEQRLISKLKTKNSEIDLNIISEDFDDIEAEHPYVTKTALLKFYIPQMFKNADKMLYLDDDIIVQGSLNELYECDVENVYAAVVRDMNATIKGCAERIGHKCYFNSGMMLLNLKKMRQEGITDKLINYKKKSQHNNFMDQDTFNKIFNEEVIYLPPNNNYLKTVDTHQLSEIAEFYDLTEDEILKISAKPLVMHLAGGIKPWDTVFAKEFSTFMFYFNKLPAGRYKFRLIKDRYCELISYFIRKYIQKILESAFNFIITDSIYDKLLKIFENFHINENSFMVMNNDSIKIKLMGKYRKLNRKNPGGIL